jgi:hypothetical protein
MIAVCKGCGLIIINGNGPLCDCTCPAEDMRESPCDCHCHCGIYDDAPNVLIPYVENG